MAPTEPVAPSRGDIIMVGLDPTIGHEQGGERPALVVSADAFNRSRANLVIVAPVTGTDRGIPAHVRVSAPEGGLTKTSVVMTDQIRCISRRRIVRRLGTVSSSIMARIDERLKLILDLS